MTTPLRRRAKTERTEIAFHEAGHAVVGLIFGDPIGTLTISPKGPVLGSYCGSLDRMPPSILVPSKDKSLSSYLFHHRAQAERIWMMKLAGIAAEVIRNPIENCDLLDNHKGSGDVADVLKAMQDWDRPETGGRAAALWLDAQDAWLAALGRRTEKLLRRKAVWLAVEDLAELLLRHTTLSDSQIGELNRQLQIRLKRVIQDVRRKHEDDAKRLAVTKQPPGSRRGRRTGRAHSRAER